MSPSTRLARLVVLISGSGSNLQAILDACASGKLQGQVCAVISNRADAYGLARAHQAGVPGMVMEKRKDQDRRSYDRELADLVATFQPDFVVLAGWMRLLTSAFLDCFPNRVINLHPALPGAYPGTHAIQRAFEDYQKGRIQNTGVMVHLVPDEGIDCGPVLAQEPVPILPDDSLETLEQRIHQTEHRLLVNTLQAIIEKTLFNPK